MKALVFGIILFAANATFANTGKVLIKCDNGKTFRVDEIAIAGVNIRGSMMWAMNVREYTTGVKTHLGNLVPEGVSCFINATSK